MVLHPKGGKTFGTCVEDNIAREKEEHKSIVICGFDYKLFEEEGSGRGDERT